MKAYIWGTGKIAKALLRQGISAEIFGFLETRPDKECFMEKRVYSYMEIPAEYDAIIVANTYSYDIWIKAQKQGLDMEKFIFLCKGAPVNPEANLQWKRNVLGENAYRMYLACNEVMCGSEYENEKMLYSKLNNRPNFDIKEEYEWPIMQDRFEEAGIVRNYFWQDLWAAKLIHQQAPKEHFDIGSRLDGFIAHVLAFEIPVHMIDIRPFPCQIEGLDTFVADATELAEFEDNSIESLSALCSLEHFGLGRYGDPIDPEACFKCFASIQRKLKKNGHLYISVPIGKERVEFNAHRVFYASTIRDCFNRMELIEYSCAAENKIEYNVPLHKYDEDGHNGEYRYGLFHFVRK